MAAPHHDHADNLHNADVAHEHHDINVRAVLWFVGFLTAITVAIQIAMWGMFEGLNWYERRNEPYVTPLAREAGQPFPKPTLQTTPWTDLRVFQAEQQRYLHSYGWVDEKLGVARMPIGKAKELLLQRGIPVRPELAADMEGTNVAAGGESSGGRTLPAGGADKSAPAGGGGFVSPDAVATPAAPAKPGGPGAPKAGTGAPKGGPGAPKAGPAAPKPPQAAKAAKAGGGRD